MLATFASGEKNENCIAYVNGIPIRYAFLVVETKILMTAGPWCIHGVHTHSTYSLHIQIRTAITLTCRPPSRTPFPFSDRHLSLTLPRCKHRNTLLISENKEG